MSITPSEARELRMKVDQAGQDIQSLKVSTGYLKDSDQTFRDVLVKLTVTVDALAEELRELKAGSDKPAKKGQKG